MSADYSDLDMIVDDAAISDGANTNQADDFVLLPQGTYPFTVKSVKFSNYQPKPGKTSGITSSCKKIEVGIIVDGGDEGRAWVDENLYFYPTCMFKILSLFKSVGLIKDGYKGSLPWDSLKGSKGTGVFDRETYHSIKYNADRERMVTKKFVKASVQTNAPVAAEEDFSDIPF